MKKIKSIDGGVVKPEIKLNSDNSEIFVKESPPGEVIEIEPSEFEKVKALQKEIFNIKFNYDRLLNFTRDLLTHEQHVKFADEKKEIFG